MILPILKPPQLSKQGTIKGVKIKHIPHFRNDFLVYEIKVTHTSQILFEEERAD